MKKLIFAIISATLIFTACNKSKLSVNETSTLETSENLSTDAIHYYKGKQVLKSNDIESYNSNELAVLLTSNIDGNLSYYYFDNLIEEQKFVKQYPQLNEVQTQLQRVIDVRAYAVSSGALVHYQQTAEVLQSFTKYIHKNTRGWNSRYSLWDKLNAAAGQNVLIVDPAPILGTFDNKAESYAGNQNSRAGTVFKNVFFQGASLTIVPSASFIVNLPVGFRNNISSAISD